MAVNGSSRRLCGVIGCDRRHVSDTLSNNSKIYSNYCQDHTCQAPRNDHVPFCINPRDPANRYCAFHGKCRARACTAQAARGEKLPFPYLCPHHRCVRCSSPRFNAFRVCEAHLTCQVRGCPNHPDPKHPGLLCRAHSCAMVSRCAHQAVGEVAGTSHCARHLPCDVVQGCKRLRVTLENGQVLPNCDEHILCARAGQGCKPSTLARAGTRWCPVHKCSLEGCPDEKGARSLYCQRHTCDHGACAQNVYHIGNPAAHFCSSHECAEESCRLEGKTVNGYCDGHGCTHGSCNALRKVGRGALFCAEHCCKAADCRYEATHRKGFCQRHACETRDCRQPRLGRHGNDHIPVCIDHYADQVRRRAESDVSHDYNLRHADLEDDLRELARRERIRKAKEQEEEDRAIAAEMQEEDKRRIRAEAEKLREADETRRVEEEMQREEEDARINEAAARLIDAEAREKRRVEREEQRRLDEAARVLEERAEARRRREREERERREREREAQEARMRDRLGPGRRSTEYRHVPAPAFGRGGGRSGSGRRDGVFEFGDGYR